MPDSAPAHLPVAVVLAFGVLIGWRIYRRTRRMVGRQAFNSARSWITLVVFPVIALALLAGLMGDALRGGAEVLGLTIGIGLAVYGLRLTKFERTADGFYYTPNAHIGIVLSLLLAGRIAYRFLQIYLSTNSPAVQPQAFARTPLTLLCVGTLAGYYAWYALGLIRWHRSALVGGATR